MPKWVEGSKKKKRGKRSKGEGARKGSPRVRVWIMTTLHSLCTVSKVPNLEQLLIILYHMFFFYIYSLVTIEALKKRMTIVLFGDPYVIKPTINSIDIYNLWSKYSWLVRVKSGVVISIFFSKFAQLTIMKLKYDWTCPDDLMFMHVGVIISKNGNRIYLLFLGFLISNEYRNVRAGAGMIW